MLCLKCGSTIKVVAFITDFQAVDCIIDHLKLTFVAEKPPPSRVLTEVALMAAEQRMEYFLRTGDFFWGGRGLASFGRFSGRPRR
jgi:hypothetical protein